MRSKCYIVGFVLPQKRAKRKMFNIHGFIEERAKSKSFIGFHKKRQRRRKAGELVENFVEKKVGYCEKSASNQEGVPNIFSRMSFHSCEH